MAAMKTRAATLLMAGAFAATAFTGAFAHEHYGVRYVEPQTEQFRDAEPPVGFVFMRHSPRCEYPNGWSSTDFVRNLNGIPRSGHELLATGCGSFRPLSD